MSQSYETVVQGGQVVAEYPLNQWVLCYSEGGIISTVRVYANYAQLLEEIHPFIEHFCQFFDGEKDDLRAFEVAHHPSTAPGVLAEVAEQGFSTELIEFIAGGGRYEDFVEPEE